MIDFNLKNYIEKLNQQVIHMDQGLVFNPEFHASRSMSDYPSRKLQLARAVYLEQLEPSEYILEILNNSILSRQGERWQCFGESPEDYTDLMILARQLMSEKGFTSSGSKVFQQELAKNNGRLYKNIEATNDAWSQALAPNPNSKTLLLLSEPSWQYCSSQATNLAGVLQHLQIETRYLSPIFLGWEYFTLGMVKQGKEHLQKLVDGFQKEGIERIVTSCGAGEYILKDFCKKLNIPMDIVVVGLLDLIGENKSINKSAEAQRSFLYAGSFYTRYLDKSDVINGLLPANEEYHIKSTEEKVRLYSSPSQRANDVSLWQKPLCPEYEIFNTVPENILSKIYSNGIADYNMALECDLVVFEPHTFQKIRQSNPEISCKYYWELFS